MSLNYKLEAGYHFSGDATDFSGNGNNGTTTNVTYVNDKNGIASSAASLGTNGYVSLSPTLINSKQTINFWFKPNWNSNDGVNHVIMGGNDTGVTGNFRAQKFSDNNWYIGWTGSGSDYRVVIPHADMPVTSGVWYMITITWDDANNETKVYLDRDLKGSNTTSLATITLDNFYFGTYEGLNVFSNMTGDELIFYSRALTQYEISQLYYDYDTEENQVGILNEGLEAAYHMEDTSDWSGNGNTLTYNGTTLTTDKNGVSNAARSFNGTSDYANSLVLNTNQYAIGCWVKMDTTTGNLGILDNYDVAGAFIRTTNSGNGIKFWQMTASITYDSYLYSTTDTTNWFFVMQTYDGTTIKRYVNGELVDSSTNTYSPSSLSYNIGRVRDGTKYFNGKIDEPRFYKRALTDIEVYMLYLGYDTEDTAVETLNEGLVFGSHFNNGNSSDYSGNGNDGTVNGAVATIDKNGVTSQALDFDGIDDYVDLPSLGNYNSEDSISYPFWFKTSMTDLGTYINYNEYLGVNETFLIGIDGRSANGDGNIRIYSDTGLFNGSNGINSQSGLNDNSWHLAVYTQDGNTAYLYIDGELSVSSTLNSGISIPDTYLNIGREIYDGSYRRYWDGVFDEPRIYNRNLFQDEVIELTYGYDEPTMLASIEEVNNTNSLFMFGGL